MHKGNRISLFAIDLQNDFCDPKGSLYVPGAEWDIERVAGFIKRAPLDNMFFSLDTHQPGGIFFAEAWTDKEGKHPTLFTRITHKDVADGKWVTKLDGHWVRAYLELLERDGKETLTIWPHHTMAYEWGHNIVPAIKEAVKEWEEANSKHPTYYQKGMHDLTEWYSVLEAEVPYPYSPGTNYQQAIASLIEYSGNTVYVVGEAQSHCVKNTLRSICENAPSLASKLVILEDCMSPIGDFDTRTDPVFQKCVSLGAKIAKSTDMTFN